jgi:hypothetical protein
MRCPQCGTEAPEDAWNCPTCRINLYWAHQHFEELARILSQQGTASRTSTPPFLVAVSSRELNDRDARGLNVMNKVRIIARRVMNGEASELP